MLRKLSSSLLIARKATYHYSSAVRPICDLNSNAPAALHPDNICESMAPFRKSSADGGFVWSSRYGQITVPDETLAEFVWKDMAKWHKRTAIECGVTGRSYSYGKLRDHCAAMAYRLRNTLNLKSGDVVAISMTNVPEYAIVALGALEAGLKLTTVNPSYTPRTSHICFGYQKIS